jgi:CRP/FNR family transcriptional regulator, nitrogen oxide reductase regulator
MKEPNRPHRRRASPLSHETIEAAQCSYDLKLRIVGNLPFFAGLTGQDIALSCGAFHDHAYTPGVPVYSAGQPATRLFAVAVGHVKLIRSGAGGQSLLIDIMGEGEFFGSLAHVGEELYSDSSVAHTQSCILGIDSGGFQAILSSHPSVSLRLVDILAERLRLAHEQLGRLCGLSVEGRTAYTLLRLAKKFGEPWRFGTLIQLPLSREDLGEMAGTTAESASRAVSRFSREGLIRTGRRWVAVIDFPRLSLVAGE